MIYTSEAHPADVWPIGESAGTINYKHKTIDDRKKCALKFINEYEINFDVYLDNMNNDFRNTMASWPFRYYIIQKSIIKFIPKPIDSTFDITELYENLY